MQLGRLKASCMLADGKFVEVVVTQCSLGLLKAI